jgi:threonine dehydratase
MTPLAPTILDIYGARRRLSRFLRPTPLLHSTWLSAATGAEVHLKLESIQPTHSFKIRGALNALVKLAEQAGGHRREKPMVVTASAGNHGCSMAMAAAQLGFRATVFTPATAPEAKKSAIRQHGAELRDDAPDYDAAEHEARAYAAAAQGALYLSPYNHGDVIAGAGTVALEVLEELPTLETIVVPLGGGGLASGIAIVMKAAAPRVTVIGVEVEASTAFATSLARGAITKIGPRPSLADGLAGNLEPWSITFDLVRRYVDRVVSVSEWELERAIRGLAADEHLIAEGAGATATAAVLARRAVETGQRGVVMLTGANIDWTQFISAVVRAESRPGSAGSAPGATADRR